MDLHSGRHADHGQAGRRPCRHRYRYFAAQTAAADVGNGNRPDSSGEELDVEGVLAVVVARANGECVSWGQFALGSLDVKRTVSTYLVKMALF